MIITCLQSHPLYLDIPHNLSHASHLLDGTEADLFVLPELFATGYFFQSTADAASVAEPAEGGRTLDWMSDLAEQKGAVVVGGFVERGAQGELYNSAAIAQPSGARTIYRKAHLYYEEKTHFEPGTSLVVVEAATRAGEAYRLGVMICFDWFFPETARSLALAGADVIAHPANLVLPHCPQAMPIRALENRVFTATANRIGTEQRGEEQLRFIGRSLICSPSAEVLAEAPTDAESVITAEVDVARARSKRLNPHNEVFQDRRTAVYRLEGPSLTP
jgi:predicted amidohydrolase